MSAAAWSFAVDCDLTDDAATQTPLAGRVRALLGLRARPRRLYEGFALTLSPGELTAVIGPSGAGKSVLLRELARQAPRAVWVDPALAGDERPAIDALTPAGQGVERLDLAGRLDVLSRCGLAEAAVLVCPARCLSAGQQFRLALARAICLARLQGPALLLVDEFGANLDEMTARMLARQLRKLVAAPGSELACVAAVTRAEILAELRPAQVVVKPCDGPPRIERPTAWPAVPPEWDVTTWPIVTGGAADYAALARYHYLAGRPAVYKRIWAIRGAALAGLDDALAPACAAVLVVTPPVLQCRARNVVLGERYLRASRGEAGRLLGREIECIARVIVHPMYRGAGLAVRLVRHALATAGAPLVEALAAMGAVNPFFERAGMTAYPVPPDVHARRLLSAADAAGLTAGEVSAVEPVTALLARADTPQARLLRHELDRYIARGVPPHHRHSAEAVAMACRHATSECRYYLAQRPDKP